MPVYTYRCENCGHEFDRHQSFSDEPLKACPKCRKHALQKVYKPAGVSFKGSGFYVTDKRSSSSSSSGKPAKKKETNGSSETKTEKSEPSKTENKPSRKED